MAPHGFGAVGGRQEATTSKVASREGKPGLFAVEPTHRSTRSSPARVNAQTGER